MNDELKNILDEFMNFDFNSQGERMEINEYERNILKDYITNLQQENQDNMKCIKSIKEQLESVINENQRLLNKWFENNDKMVELIGEKTLYKSRIEKAVEYIEKEKSNYMRSCDISNATNREGLILSSAVRTCDDTLNILNGRSDE